MCKWYFELTHRLLLKVARAIWGLIFSCLGISCIVSNSVPNHLLAWKGFLGRESEEGKEYEC